MLQDVEGGGPQVQLEAARFAGDSQYATCTTAIGGVGATNFEVQALVYLEGARETQDRVFMVQFPASRQAGLFCSNVSPHNLHAGDSQVGSVGGAIGANPSTGQWCLLTFAADGNNAEKPGEWVVTIQSLDGTIPYTEGGRTKGVEASLTGERVDLNGGGVDFGWANGIRYAEFRAYDAIRNQSQREADLTNTTDFTDALFWFRFSDDGMGGLSYTDMTGNHQTLDIVNGTLAEGPLV